MVQIHPLIPIRLLTPGARMFIGMAIGDAFGSRFENQMRDSILLNGEEETYREWNRYTDDTQMAIGVAELLISGHTFTGENLAASLIHAYRRDPRCGYSSLTRTMLEESPDGIRFLQFLPDSILRERKSDGAAMRALPIGFIKNREEVIRFASLSASITHGHPDAVASTIGIALIAHERYYTGNGFPDIIRNIPGHIPGLTTEAAMYLDRVISAGWDPDLILGRHHQYGVPYTESIILLAAVMILLATFGDDPHRTLLEAVRLGGDTDTTACIALAAALIHPSRDTIPEELYRMIEDGPYGRSFLISLGDRLNDTYPLPTDHPDKKHDHK